MRIPRRVPGPWVEPVRLVIALTWIAGLSLWTWQTWLGLYAWSRELVSTTDARIWASSILRTGPALWWACYLPALAFGVSWYAFSLRLIRQPTTAVSVRLDRLAACQAVGGLCVALAWNVILVRALIYTPLMTTGVDRAAPALLVTQWPEAVHQSRHHEHLALMGALLAVVAVMQVWGVVPRLGGRRRRFVGLVAVALAGGVAVDLATRAGIMPTAVPPSVSALGEVSDLHRGLLLGHPEHSETAERHLATYVSTRAGTGNINIVWPLDDGHPYRCSSLVLPRVHGWTLGGLTLALAPDGAVRSGSHPESTQVVEVSRQGITARVGEPGASGREVPLTSIGDHVGPSDRVVLKVDVMVPAARVLGVLDRLRAAGAGQAELAVVPLGLTPLPERPARLVLDAQGAVPAPPPSPPQSATRKRYVPPPPDVDGPCPFLDDRAVLGPSARGRHAPGSLPGEVGLELEPHMPYAELVARLEALLAGGAETIVLDRDGAAAR